MLFVIWVSLLTRLSDFIRNSLYPFPSLSSDFIRVPLKFPFDMSPRLKSLLPWLVGYAVFMAAAVGGTCVWRNAALEHLNTPEERQRWLDYQGEVVRQEADEITPVKHKISTRDEPPLLVWLRERFVAILAAVVVFGSVFFGITMFLVRGLWSSSTVSFPGISEVDPKP